MNSGSDLLLKKRMVETAYPNDHVWSKWDSAKHIRNWPTPLSGWNTWVECLQKVDKLIWQKQGIATLISLSTKMPDDNKDILKGLFYFWC